MTLGLCLRCDQTKNLVEAHVIPKCLYTFGEKPLVLASKFKERLSLSQMGVYDRELLCEKCDNDFGKYDGVAASKLKLYPVRTQFLRDENGFILRRGNGRPLAYVVPDPGVSELQCFFASLIWKCCLTSREEMSLKGAGQFFEKAEHLLRNPETGTYFGVFGNRIQERQLNCAVARPTVTDLELGKMIQFHMSGFIASIFLDPIMAVESELQLISSDRWIVGLTSFEETSFGDSIQEMRSKLAAAAGLFRGHSSVRRRTGT
ncbi:MAG: hypothetical protein ACKVP5_18170 [Aestuariivirga sp.]